MRFLPRLGHGESARCIKHTKVQRLTRVQARHLETPRLCFERIPQPQPSTETLSELGSLSKRWSQFYASA